jgi:hypothetical protein
MTITVKIEASKPNNVEWFPQSSVANFELIQTLNAWTASQPGFISQLGEDPTLTSRIVTIIWDTVENYVTWHEARDNRPEQVARVSYNSSNNITTSITEIIS